MLYICSVRGDSRRAFFFFLSNVFFPFGLRQTDARSYLKRHFSNTGWKRKLNFCFHLCHYFQSVPFHRFPSQSQARGASETLNDPSQAAVTRRAWCAVKGKLDFSLWSAIKAQPEGVLEKLANKYGRASSEHTTNDIYSFFFFLREKHEQTHLWEIPPSCVGKESNQLKFGLNSEILKRRSSGPFVSVNRWFSSRWRRTGGISGLQRKVRRWFEGWRIRGEGNRLTGTEGHYRWSGKVRRRERLSWGETSSWSGGGRAKRGGFKRGGRINSAGNVIRKMMK